MIRWAIAALAAFSVCRARIAQPLAIWSTCPVAAPHSETRLAPLLPTSDDPDAALADILATQDWMTSEETRRKILAELDDRFVAAMHASEWGRLLQVAEHHFRQIRSTCSVFGFVEGVWVHDLRAKTWLEYLRMYFD